ncbi:MAG: fibro-slime domain-containing protein [Cyanobacteria bacterium P01_F01_bin.116]
MPQIKLSGRIRDFNDSHADFQHVIATEKNIVGPILGDDQKPIYKGGEGKTTSNKENFDQWFRDTTEVNQGKRFDIVLNDDDNDGIFTYDNQEFFPIDNELFGNQGRPHNYHFTYEIHSAFTYQGHEKFTFDGDDDLWLYIDGKLVIDLGGVHKALTDTVDLQLTNGSAELTLPLDTGETLTLRKGENYSFALFFAERHTSESHFRIDTSMLLKPAPVICIKATDPKATEPKHGVVATDTGKLLIYAEEPVMEDTVVTYTVGGSATEGSDYKSIERSVTLLKGQKEAVIEITPLADKNFYEGVETVVLTLQPGENYDLDDCKVAKVKIAEPKYVKPEPPKPEPPKSKKLYYVLICCLLLLLVVFCGAYFLH